MVISVIKYATIGVESRDASKTLVFASMAVWQDSQVPTALNSVVRTVLKNVQTV